MTLRWSTKDRVQWSNENKPMSFPYVGLHKNVFLYGDAPNTGGERSLGRKGL